LRGVISYEEVMTKAQDPDGAAQLLEGQNQPA
jgi:hypothetical protein